MSNQPLLPDARLSWERALAARATRGTGSSLSALASRRLPGIGRRRFLLGAFFATLGATSAAAVSALLDFLYPRGVTRTGGPVAAGNIIDHLPGGAPVLNTAGHFYLINLDPADATANGGGGGAGLLALWRKCPHLGCAVPWDAGFEYAEELGWFRCPCHQSTYTRAGVRVYGPAPRSMDTMRVEVAADGSVTVHTDEITRGGPDNPTRAVRPG